MYMYGHVVICMYMHVHLHADVPSANRYQHDKVYIVKYNTIMWAGSTCLFFWHLWTGCVWYSFKCIVVFSDKFT